MILERDKEQRVLRSRATQTMSNEVVAQKNSGPSGSPIFRLLHRCSSVMCHRHITFLAPCTNSKSGTPNSQTYFETAPILLEILVSKIRMIHDVLGQKSSRWVNIPSGSFHMTIIEKYIETSGVAGKGPSSNVFRIMQ